MPLPSLSILAKVLQISFTELFLRNDYDFILEAFNVNDIPKDSSLSIQRLYINTQSL